MSITHISEEEVSGRVGQIGEVGRMRGRGGTRIDKGTTSPAKATSPRVALSGAVSGGRNSVTRRDFIGRSIAASGALALSPLLAACGRDEGTEGADEGDRPLQEVGLLLDVAPYGKHAMFFAPLELGYWEQVGLDVTIDSARGSADCVSKVAAGAADFGFADTGSVIVGRAQDALLQDICMVHYRNLMTILSFEEANINEPKDLEGKTVGIAPGGADERLMPVFAKLNDFDVDKVNFVHVDVPSHMAVLANNRVDAISTFSTFWPSLLDIAEKKGKEPNSFLFSDFGLQLYSNAIVARDELLNSDPDLTRRFLQALVRGIVWTVENPDEATSMLVASQPGLGQDIARAQLQVAIDHLLVDEVRDHGVGPVSPEKMEQTVELVNDNFDLPRVVDPEEVYTNEFVPKGEVPEV